MGQTRRRLLKSLASLVMGCGSVDQVSQKSDQPDTIKMRQNQNENHPYQDMNRKAFITLPGFGLTTTYMHLYTIMNRRPRPVLLMDTYDFERTWGQIVMNRGDRKIQMLGMITESLYRQGLLRTIDYRSFYPENKQNKNINEYWQALETLPDAKQEQAACQLADGFLDHCIGEYQKSFRNALCDWDGVADRRRKIKNHQRKVDSGCGSPVLWNERMAAEYLAALEVRATADKYLDLDVVGVLGQGEAEGISTVLRESDLGFDDDVASLTADGRSIKQVWRPDPDETAYERSILDSISQVAQKTTGTQYNDWYLMGSRLAVPHFPKLFMESWSQPNIKKNTKELAAEAQEVLSLLERRAEDNQPSHLQYGAEAIAEQHGVSSSEKINEISEQLDRMADLANYTPILRDLSDSDQFSAGAIMVAASITMDPNSRIDEDDWYRHAWSMKQRTRSVDVPPYIIERFSKRGGIRREENKHITDWYHSAKRTRGVS